MVENKIVPDTYPEKAEEQEQPLPEHFSRLSLEDRKRNNHLA